LKAAFTMLSIWFVQFPSDAKVNPKCLWVFAISTGSPLNRRSECDGCFEREVATLEKVQLESARIFTGLPKCASRDSLYYETGWEPLS
jgi:hypothetical protein